MRHLFKAFLLTAAITFSGGVLAHAQTASAPSTQSGDASSTRPYHHARKMDPARETQHLTKALGLNESQAASVEKILENRQNSMQALRTNTSLDRKSMHQQMRTIQSDTQQAMNQVLTSEQQQQLATLKAEHHHRRGGEGTPVTVPAPTV